MKLLKFLVKAFLVLVIASCTSTLKRHKSLSESQTNNDLVNISVLAASFEETSQAAAFKTVFDLSDKGQSSVLLEKSNEQIVEILNQKFQQKQQNGISKTIDLSTKKIKVTFSISRNVSFNKSDFSAFDRIEDLKYTFKLSDNLNPEISFEKWNKYTTEYGSLEIGSLEFNQGFTANLDVTGKVGANYSSKESTVVDDNTSENSSSFGPELSATGKTGYSRSQKETQLVKQRFIQLTGEFGKRNFSIHQQGNRETELAGNVSIDLTINFPKDEVFISSFSNLFDQKLMRKEPKDVNLNVVRYYIPDVEKIENGISGNLSFNFAVRHLEKGSKSFAEFDDRVYYIVGKKENKEVVLIERKNIITPIYYLTINNNALKIENSSTIQFLNFNDALEFKSWLIQTYENLKEEEKIVISNYGILFQNLTTKEVKNSLDEIRIIVAGND